MIKPVWNLDANSGGLGAEGHTDFISESGKLTVNYIIIYLIR